MANFGRNVEGVWSGAAELDLTKGQMMIPSDLIGLDMFIQAP